MLPEEAPNILTRAAKDPHAYVRHLAVRAMDAGEAVDEFARAIIDPHASFDSGSGGSEFAQYRHLEV